MKGLRRLGSWDRDVHAPFRLADAGERIIITYPQAHCLVVRGSASFSAMPGITSANVGFTGHRAWLRAALVGLN